MRQAQMKLYEKFIRSSTFCLLLINTINNITTLLQAAISSVLIMQ